MFLWFSPFSLSLCFFFPLFPLVSQIVFFFLFFFLSFPSFLSSSFTSPTSLFKRIENESISLLDLILIFISKAVLFLIFQVGEYNVLYLCLERYKVAA